MHTDGIYSGVKFEKAKGHVKNMAQAAKNAKGVIRNRLMKINQGNALLKKGAKLKQGALDSLEKLLQKTLSLARKFHLKITLDTSSGWPMRYLQN